MTRAAPTSETVTLHVPFRVVKRGGRKQIALPDGAPSGGSRWPFCIANFSPKH